MLQQLSIFDVEEQIAINKAITNENLKSFSKADLIKRFNFALTINKDDKEIAYLYDGLINKMNQITEEEWEKTRELLPFQIPFTEDDNNNFDVEDN